MGKYARLRSLGVTGHGVASGNPTAPNMLTQRMAMPRVRAVKFSDRAYGINLRTGEYRRLKLVEEMPADTEETKQLPPELR